MSDDVINYLLKNAANMQAVHNTDELPLFLGNRAQMKKAMQYLGEWNGAEAAHVDGKLSDNFSEFADAGYSLNEKEQAEDGAFVDVYGLLGPNGLLYLFKPLAGLFDDIIELNNPEVSKDVKELVSRPLSAYAGAAQAAERAGPQVGPRYEEQMRQTNSRMDNFWYQALPRFAAVDKMMKEAEQDAW